MTASQKSNAFYLTNKAMSLLTEYNAANGYQVKTVLIDDNGSLSYLQTGSNGTSYLCGATPTGTDANGNTTYSGGSVIYNLASSTP
jgi:hypothetical protein